MFAPFPVRSITLLLPLILVLGVGPTQAAAPIALRAMTFNLRFASNEQPNAWPDRRPVMRHLLEKESPDVFGTQEGLYRQIRDIAEDLPGYEWIGLGRGGGSRDEFAAIFFKRERFEPVAFDHFWLSDTPEVVGSMTWGNHYRRMVTWVRLRERSSGREFDVWNTHFDHEVEVARQKSAELIRDRLGALEPDVPLILLGDFNCAAGDSVAYDTLTKRAGLSDTWTLAAQRENEALNSFHDYKPALSEHMRIDWILARPPLAVARAAIVTYHEGAQYPSDHFPVEADLELR
jgi:endonuclease/exonuclease/phosphatase family metal-dependent hydrolase